MLNKILEYSMNGYIQNDCFTRVSCLETPMWNYPNNLPNKSHTYVTLKKQTITINEHAQCNHAVGMCCSFSKSRGQSI